MSRYYNYLQQSFWSWVIAFTVCCIHMQMHACRTQWHNKDGRHSSLEKYTSHFIEKVVCERELETEQNCNILTPILLAITAFLSRSPGLLNRGLGAQPLCGSICCSSVRSPTPSHTQSFQIKWEVYFPKNCVARFYCVVMILHADVYILCGYTTPVGEVGTSS